MEGAGDRGDRGHVWKERGPVQEEHERLILDSLVTERSSTGVAVAAARARHGSQTIDGCPGRADSVLPGHSRS